MALVADHFVAEFPLPMSTVELKFHLLHAGAQVGFQSGTVVTLENRRLYRYMIISKCIANKYYYSPVELEFRLLHAGNLVGFQSGTVVTW